MWLALYRAERRNFLRKKIGFLAHVCCISLYRALYMDFLRKFVLKKIRITVFLTLYSVYQAKIRSNSGAFVSTSNPICRKIAISAIFSQIGNPDKEKSYKMHFFCVFFSRALAYVRKKQYLCIAFRKRVQAFFYRLTRARADKVQRCKRLRCSLAAYLVAVGLSSVRFGALPIWSRFVPFLLSSRCLYALPFVAVAFPPPY